MDYLKEHEARHAQMRRLFDERHAPYQLCGNARDNPWVYVCSSVENVNYVAKNVS